MAAVIWMRGGFEVSTLSPISREQFARQTAERTTKSAVIKISRRNGRFGRPSFPFSPRFGVRETPSANHKLRPSFSFVNARSHDFPAVLPRGRELVLCVWFGEFPVLCSCDDLETPMVVWVQAAFGKFFFLFFFLESFANRSIQKYSYMDHTEVENRSIVIKEMTCYLENERFHRCQVDTKIKNFSGTRVDRFGLRMSHTRFGSSDDLRIGNDVSWWIKNYISRYNVLWILWVLWSSMSTFFSLFSTKLKWNLIKR